MYKKSRQFIFILLIVGFLAGCASTPKEFMMSNYPFITVQEQLKIKLDMTQENVISILGFPLEVYSKVKDEDGKILDLWVYQLRYPFIKTFAFSKPWVNKPILYKKETLNKVSWKDRFRYVLLFENGKLKKMGRWNVVTDNLDFEPDLAQPYRDAMMKIKFMKGK